MNTRILLIDDHEIVREGIRTLIARSRPDWVICAEAPDGRQAIELALSLKPDLIVMDITMPDVSGFEAVARLRKSGFDRPILMFTMHESSRLESESKEAGAQGYVLKSQAAKDLVRAIDILLNGGSFFGMPFEKEREPNLKPDSGPIFFRGFDLAFA